MESKSRSAELHAGNRTVQPLGANERARACTRRCGDSDHARSYHNLTERRNMTGSMLRIVSTIVVGGLICAPVAGAQDSQFRRYNPNPSIIAGQIRLAMQRGQQAQIILATGPLAAESVRAVRASVQDSYVLARFAQGGVQQARGNSKFPDPTLQLQRD